MTAPRGLLLAALLLLAGAAHADPVAVTLGASPVQLVPGGKSMRLISVDNESTTTAIAVCFGYSSGTTPCTPAINSAGSYTIAAGITRTWSATDTTFYGPVYGVAAGAGTPVTVNYQ